MANKRKKNKLAFPVGIIAIVLATIGLVTIISKGIGFIKTKTEKAELKLQYEEMLKPVVMFDPDPFDDLTQADIPQLLNSAVWALLMSENGTEKYPYSQGETVGIVVPQADIEKYFIDLFGTEIDITSMHSSIDMSTYDITYDAALKSYILPITGVDSAYVPKVYSIDEQGSSVILNVGYIGSKAWADIDSDEFTAPEPDKYMKITLRERSGGMYISSIQAADGQEIASQILMETHHEEPEPEETSTEVPTQEPETTIENVTDEYGNEVTDENGENVTTVIFVENESEQETVEDTSSTIAEETTTAIF